MPNLTATIATASIAGILSLIAPTEIQVVLFIMLVVLIFLDLGTGLTRAYKTKKPITSHGLGQTCTKMLTYFSLVTLATVLSFIGVHVLMLGPIACSLTAIVLSFLNLREGYSILENCSKMGYKIPKFLKKLMGHMEEMIDDTTEV